MEIEVSKDGEVLRKQVWLTAWCYVATASNCNDQEAPARWADKCLSDFDERFGHASKD